MATYSNIKEKLNINVDKHLNDGFAHLTHYWQNHKNGVSQYFKSYATEYLQDEILSIVEEPEQLYIPLKFDVPFPPKANPKFKFIDLFAGIGGIRLAYQNLGGNCVFTSEWNNFAKKLTKPTLVNFLLAISQKSVKKIFLTMTFYWLVFHANLFQ